MGLEVIYNSAGAIIEQRTTPDLDIPRSWDAYDFKLRFTADERKAIRTAAKSNADVEDFLDMLDTAAATGTRIKSDDALLNAGLAMMEAAGLIGAGRAAEIVA